MPPLTISAVAAATLEPAPQITTRVVFAVAVLGLACTAGGFTGFFALINTEGPARAAFITYLAPVMAVAAGVAVLAEPITAHTIAGTLLILAGAAAAARRPAETQGGSSSAPRRSRLDSRGILAADNERTSVHGDAERA